MPQVLDLEQALLLLELEPPFEKRDVQAARRRMAKVWHPDIAPPGKQIEHERHLKAVNEAADQLERLAEGSRGGKVSRNAVKVSAQAARAARAEAGRRNYEAQERARAQAADRQTNDPFGDRMPDHSVVHRYARCNSYPEWGVGTVSGIYFTGEGDDVQQWARVKFAPGVRTVPAGSLQFVDFSKPDPAHDRVQRFMTAAQHAMAEGKPDPELQCRGLRAEFFVCAGRLGTPEFLDEDDLHELRRAGMPVGSHGMDHVPWRRLAPPAIEHEIFRAKQRLEDALQAPVETAACPFGAYDRRTLKALRAAGFEHVYTSDRGRARPADWLVARNTVGRTDSAESIERMLNGLGEAVPVVDRAKRLVKRWR